MASTCSEIDCKHARCANATYPSIISPSCSEHHRSVEDPSFSAGGDTPIWCKTCASESTIYYPPDTSSPVTQTPLAQKERYEGDRGKLYRLRQGWGETPPGPESELVEATGYDGVSTADFENSRITEVDEEAEDTDMGNTTKEVEGHDVSFRFTSRSNDKSPSKPSDDSFLPDPPETSMTLEPFTIFRKRVQGFMRRTGKAYTADYVEDFGVSSHRIIAIHHKKKPRSSKSLPSQILRIPRKTKLWTDEQGINVNIHHHVAVKAYIRRLNLTAGPPAWLAYDATAENELGCGYILEAFCKDGVLRDQMWCRDIETKLDICEQVINILTEQGKIVFPEAGKLVSAWKLADRHSDYISGIQNPQELSTSVKIEGLGIGVRIAPQKILAGVIKEFIKAWPLRENIWFLTSFEHMWEKLRVVAFEMNRLRFFDDEDNYDSGVWSQEVAALSHVLYHGDLDPRNLAVTSSGPGDRIVITEMLDWDDTVAVPAVIARRPPVWLWCPDISNLEPNWDGDYDTLKKEPPLTEDGKRVKALFFRKMEYQFPGYTRDCYNPRKRWTRRIWEIVRYGFFLGKHLARCEKFLADWEEWKQEYCPLGVPKIEDDKTRESFWTEEDYDFSQLEKLAEMQLF